MTSEPRPVAPMTDERLAGITRRVKRATPGPWSFLGSHVFTVKGQLIARVPSGYENADLIAAAPVDLAELLAEVARLKARVKELEQAVRWRDEEAMSP